MYQMWGMHVPGASAIGHLEVCRESCGQPESLPCGIILPSKASQHSQCHLHICIPSLLREHRGFPMVNLVTSSMRSHNAACPVTLAMRHTGSNQVSGSQAIHKALAWMLAPAPLPAQRCSARGTSADWSPAAARLPEASAAAPPRQSQTQQWL